jgi:hypothetical protein
LKHPHSNDGISGLTPVFGSPDDTASGGVPTGFGGNIPYVGPEQQLGVGDTFGELSFFTEIPQMTTVR